MVGGEDTCAGLEGTRRTACRRNKARHLQSQWLADLAWSPEQAIFWQIQLWQGIFPVHWRRLPDPDVLAIQIRSIRKNLNGNFSQLLTAMVFDPALQIFLNGPANHRRNPNENFGRELLELFSLGEGNYTEKDVREAARALSGYRLNAERELILEPRRHDPGMKTILGRTASFDGASLAAWLAEQPATARHISTRVWRRLVGAPPPSNRIDTIATGWRQSGLSLPWLMEAIQAAPEAVESRKLGLRMADPIEVVARSLRVLGSRHPEAVAISLRGLAAMGQMPFEPPSVKGWPVNDQWIKLRWLQERRRTLQALVANEEVWATAKLPTELPSSLTPIPPLTLQLPAKSNRENIVMLFSDPVWQLA